MRGKIGSPRYKIKRQTPISFEEFEETIQNATNLEEKSLLAFLFYTGCRVAEIVGSSPKKYKVQTEKARLLKSKGTLPKNWIYTPEAAGLWKWRFTKEHKGILKEDIELDKKRNVLVVNIRPVKRGRRSGPLELPCDLPYMNYVKKQWRRTKKGCKVWDLSPWQVWKIVKDTSGRRLYPHAYRFSRASQFARKPNISVADMRFWFGWARASTADRYIMPIRSSTKLISALQEEIQQKN